MRHPFESQQTSLVPANGTATANNDLGLNFFQALQHASTQADIIFGSGTGSNENTGLNFSGQY